MVVPSLVTIHLRRHGEVVLLLVAWSSGAGGGPRFDAHAVTARRVFGDIVRGPAGGGGAVGTEYSVQMEGALCWLNLKIFLLRIHFRRKRLQRRVSLSSENRKI